MVETSKYTDFIATKLKPALEEVEAQREKVAVTRDACVELCEQISKVLEESQAEEKTPAMETAVEIGESCFVQAVIPDASTLVVDTGVMGVLVEMPLQQALEFVAARAMLLQRRFEFAGLKAEKVAADLKDAEDILAQLKALPPES